MFDHLFTMPPHWYQEDAVEMGIAAIANKRNLCLSAPTGAGKSLIYSALAKYCEDANIKSIIYSNRRLLTNQVTEAFDQQGIDHGVIADGWLSNNAHIKNVVIASMQTVHSRMSRGVIGLPEKQVVLVDEAHAQANGMFAEIIKKHKATGACVIGITATPIGISHLYDELYIACKNSDCRKEGRLVLAEYKAPNEMDFSLVRRTKTGEYNLNQVRKIMRSVNIVGHVYDDWKRFNPDARPFLGYAPGVAEAKWFVDEYANRGVRTASIDGYDVYVDGESYRSDLNARRQIIEECRTGDIAGIWNRFVFREAIDLPWIYQGILACPIGNLHSYIQVVGRILRSHETTPRVLITDHAGNYWRHKYSPNDDIDWHKYFHGVPVTKPTDDHKEDLRDKPDEQPIVCPRCKQARRSGNKCPKCGEVCTGRKRFVVQHGGELRTIDGPIYRPKVVSNKPDTLKKWESCYYRALKSKRGMTFKQAIGLFRKDNGYYPPDDLPLMPKESADLHRKVSMVNRRDLHDY